ncbi:exodeoxyribonuclease VII small subunit [Gracilibacillus halotolerans]|uniref:Exodeoxyribonuclease 7 small subunit n=1 Tax=Gracilibacillus halotolerans TaxID=74386 RepID=A0A841RGZ4_9BACI|nr:exodeoxyribonuclease VII small subunit [Gracilibacillus halotolerans]MBB6511749.1 exodeoxyribonuclease VII small subunit [Gracilibacillus halotolerans]
MTNDISFEEALEKLEDIVNKLEAGDVPLEQAIEYYAEGSKLSKLCHDKLTKADKQLKEIMNENGEKESFIIQEEE